MGGFTIQAAYQRKYKEQNVLDMVITLRPRLLSLHQGHTDWVEDHADKPAGFIRQEPDLSSRFYLCMKNKGKLITELTPNSAAFHTDHVLAIQGNIRNFFFRHKVTWAMANPAKLANADTSAQLAGERLDYLLNLQKANGAFPRGLPYYSAFNQTA